MPQDFAKRKPPTGAKKAPVEKTQARRNTGENQPRGKGLRLYLVGVLTGVFLSFIGYLSMLPNPADPALEGGSAPPPAAAVPKPRFDFYTLLPEQTLDAQEEAVEVEPAAVVSKPPAPTAAPQPFFLQAGSFRQQDDAERRRAELLLLGLTPKLEETSNSSGRWFRVYLGPFESHESVAKARSLLANQNIDTVLLKRGGP
jgi:cell division septation protein DedD